MYDYLIFMSLKYAHNGNEENNTKFNHIGLLSNA